MSDSPTPGSDRAYVLIVDDDASTRKAVKETLTKSIPTARIIDVPSAHEAMIHLEKQRFDIIVTDYEHPRADGQSFVDEIGRLPPTKKPFGLVIGFAKENEIPKIGKTYFLSKPFGDDSLADVCRSVIDQKLMQQGWEEGKPKPQVATTAAAPAPTTSAPAQPTPPKITIDVNFINPFIEGAVVVLETVCETKSTKEAVFTRTADSVKGDVSAVIAMNSSTRQGSFAVSFETSRFLAIANRMLGESYTRVNDENKDVVGEICNQIFGFAKKKLNEQGHDIKPAIPSVITGTGHQIKHQVKGLVIAAKFKTDEGFFVVEAAVSNA